MWQLMSEYLHHEPDHVLSQIMHHVQYTFNESEMCRDAQILAQAVAASLRDRLIECFNDTQQFWAENDAKRVYLLSPIFTMGTRIKQTLISVCLYESYTEALMKIGVNLEEIFEHEQDESYCQLGLSAASWLEALATQDIPSWGYSLRPLVVNIKNS